MSIKVFHISIYLLFCNCLHRYSLNCSNLRLDVYDQNNSPEAFFKETVTYFEPSPLTYGIVASA